MDETERGSEDGGARREDAGAREQMRNVTEGHWQERRREREKKCGMKGAMRAEGWSVLAALKQQR